MIDINAIKAAQEAVNVVEAAMEARIRQKFPTAEDPSVYFKLMGLDYEIEVMTSNILTNDIQGQIADTLDEMRTELGIRQALKGGLTIYYTNP